MSDKSPENNLRSRAKLNGSLLSETGCMRPLAEPAFKPALLPKEVKENSRQRSANLSPNLL